MSSLSLSNRDIDFLLCDWLQLDKVLASEAYADLDRPMEDAIS